MVLIRVTVKYNVSTFLWNMSNPQEFWNPRLQAKIFTLLRSDWEDPSSRWSSAEHSFAEQVCSGLSKSGASMVSWILHSRMEGHQFTFGNPSHMLKQVPSFLDC